MKLREGTGRGKGALTQPREGGRGPRSLIVTLKFPEIEYPQGADFWLGWVCVRLDARGRGFGHALVAAAEAEAEAQGVRRPGDIYSASVPRQRGPCPIRGGRPSG